MEEPKKKSCFDLKKEKKLNPKTDLNESINSMAILKLI